MNCSNRRLSSLLLGVLGLFVLAGQSAHASAAAHLSGAYRIVHKTNHGSATRVKLEIHLLNPGAQDLRIRRLTLWNASHKEALHACSLVIRGRAAAVTTQEFTVRLPEYRRWAHGAPPQLLLEVQSPNGPATEVVRLNNLSSKRGN